MLKISLLIADPDEAYVESIVNFIISNHSKRFQVNSFTKKDYLLEYLSQTNKKIDILLIHPELLSEEIPVQKVRALILLGSDAIAVESKGFSIVNKYQHTEKLIGDITAILAEKHEGELLVSGGNKKLKVIAVFSPIGGAGKTCYALSSSMQCTRNGINVFYLNLEDINSTAQFFCIDNDKSLSRVFYYLKEKNKNLALKIEGARCIDHTCNLHYFSPSESALELEEMQADELVMLIKQFRIMGNYDLVYIDMSSRLESKNLAVLNACDEVHVIYTQDCLASMKLKSFIRELSIHEAGNSGIFDKITFILNKFNNNLPISENGLSEIGKAAALTLAETKELKVLNDISVLADVNNSFGSGINTFIRRFL